MEKQPECLSEPASAVENFVFVACATVKEEPKEAEDVEDAAFEELPLPECEVQIKEESDELGTFEEVPVPALVVKQEVGEVGTFEQVTIPAVDVHIKEDVDETDALTAASVDERDPLQLEEHELDAATQNTLSSKRLGQNASAEHSVSSDGAHLEATVCDELEKDTLKHTHVVSYDCTLQGFKQQRNQASYSRHYCSENHEEWHNFSCSACTEWFSTKYALIKHVFTHIDGVEPPVHVCRVCGEVFCTSDTLHSHMGTCCVRDEMVHGEEQAFTESIKGNFKDLFHLRQHAMSHTGERPHVCPCGMSFAKLCNLKRHAAVHARHKPYTCKVCFKAFPDPSALKRHLLVHTGQRSYVCDECGTSFKQLDHLKQHALCHTGEKPHVCSCGKSFTQLGSLKRHAITHTGERPFVCDICPKSFTTANALKKHKLIHSGEKPHVCRECGKSFREAGHLNKHSVLHTGSRPHVCNICGKAFTQSGSLNRHITRHKATRSDTQSVD